MIFSVKWLKHKDIHQGRLHSFAQDIKDDCGVMVIVVGNGHGDTSSNPGRDWLHFT